jgi:hypothetical protein
LSREIGEILIHGLRWLLEALSIASHRCADGFRVQVEQLVDELVRGV